MGKSGGKGNKRGFTLVETLAVVAILGILAAVAVPSVAAVQRRLHMARLDACARQIFLAAQNELTTMKASGRLVQFAETFGEDDVLGAAPADYPKDRGTGEADTRWMSLYHLSSESPAARSYLLRARQSLEDATDSGGCFLLELDPASGDIYSVFYAEQPFTYHEDVLRICGESRDQSVRREGAPLLGYYGGGLGKSPSVGTPKTFSPQITVHNGEELWVEITCGGLMPLRANQRELHLTVTVMDEALDMERAWVKEFRGGGFGEDRFFVNGDSITVTVLLDSLAEGSSFETLTGGTLTAGDDLTIYADMTYLPKSAEDQIGSGAELPSRVVNSLFAGKTGTGGKTEVAVSRVRHLNNLRSSICGGSLSGGTVIRQAGAIDFVFDKTSGDCLTLTGNPLRSFRPIENAALFSGGTVFSGEGRQISNFLVKGSGGYGGLVSTAADCTFQDVRLVDHAVTASGGAGALVGHLKRSVVSGCGVHLSTGSGVYPGDLAQRLASRTVAGGTNVGGLIGMAEGDCVIRESFAAVNVSGTQYVGGLVGYLTGGGVVRNCYASGAVAASGTVAGGLAGAERETAVTGCYATGSVSAGGYSGGLVGYAVRGKITNCRSYGLVACPEGGEEIGGLAGAVSGTDFAYCAYLRQIKYNDSFPASENVTATGYEQLRANPGNPGGVTHPYDLELWEETFPFRLARRGNGTVLPHYGDWPREYLLKTALVYYERYEKADAEGGYYGYYADVSLGAGGESDGGWNVDTLRDEVCVEDGYALLSAYALTRFDYTLDVGAGDGAGKKGTLYAVDALSADETERASQSLKLTDGVRLTFTKENDSVVINNAKAYQLPFALQVTDRFSAKTFWETLTLQNGMVGGRTVFTSYTVYYCPDFAKSARNPAEDLAPERPAEPETLYVRSARQLNGLGRSVHYWNTAEKDRLVDVTFLQETDIDFGRYGSGGNGEKTYCGEPFDLMDTTQSNPYRNRPIGRAGDQAGKSFRNTYDGQGHEIIDYCCAAYEEDDYQFTGLFGQVQGGVLKNIVMRGSDPENPPYIRSQFNDAKNRSGVGVLAGLLYEKNPSEYGETCAVISNCAVSGYTVSYTSPGKAARYSCGAGGLAGVSFGRIEDSTAVSLHISAATEKDAYLGGVAGSLNGRGTIQNCYSGMTDFADGAYVGGICGGYYADTPGDGKGASDQGAVRNCYAFWKEGGSPAYPITKTAAGLTVEDCVYLKDGGVAQNGAGTACSLSEMMAMAQGQTAAVSYPVSELPGDYPFRAVVQIEERYVHYGDWPPAASYAPPMLVYYETYGDGSIGYFSPGAASLPQLDTSDGKTILTAGYGVLCGEDRAFQMKIDAGWMAEQGALLVESGAKAAQTVNGAVRFLYPLTGACARRLAAAGWRNTVPAILYYKDDGAKSVSQTLHVNTLYGASVFTAATGGAGEQAPFQVRTAGQLQSVGPGNQNRYFLQTHSIDAEADTGWVDMNWNTGTSTYDGNGYAIRGLRQTLFNQVNYATLKDISLEDVQISDDRACAPLALYNNANGTILRCFAQGSVRSTAGAAGLVYQNQGVIQQSYANCAVEGRKAAGFVWSNNGGRIFDCYAGANGGVIRAAAEACGFVGSESWSSRIERCYTVAAADGRTVFGFGPGNIGISYVECRWAKDAGQQGASGGSQGGTQTTLQALEGWNPGTVWTKAAPDESHPGSSHLQGLAYPYPKLAGLDHHGDWPEGGAG